MIDIWVYGLLSLRAVAKVVTNETHPNLSPYALAI